MKRIIEIRAAEGAGLKEILERALRDRLVISPEPALPPQTPSKASRIATQS